MTRNLITKLLLIIPCIFFVSVPSIDAQEAQWRGPNRNGVYPETSLLKEWPENGPEVLFATEGIGRGFSSAVATEEMIYVTGTKDTTEYLTALDHQGSIIWQKPYGPSWENTFPDSRSTPTVEDNRVYIISGSDVLACLHAKTGEELFTIDLHEKYHSSWDMFGVSESVLIVDDKIIASIGGKESMVIALDKLTGELVWKSKSLGMNRSNMSPIAIDHCGEKYIITASQTHVLGVDAKNGEIVWDYQHNYLDHNNDNRTILANSPIYRDSCLWISNGWDVKSAMLKIAPDGRSVTEKLTDHTFDNQNHGVVLLDTLLFGSNFKDRNNGKWICMNWNTGEILWIADFHNKGPIIAADGMLYCIEEKRGNIALVEPDPDEFKIISTFRIRQGMGPFWARPSIYFGKLLIRHGDVLIGYDVRES